MRWLIAALLTLLATAATADELRPGYLEYRQRGSDSWSLAWKQPIISPTQNRFSVPLVPQGCRILDGPHRRVVTLADVGNAVLACDRPLAGTRVGYRDIPGGGDVLLRIVPLKGASQSYRLTPQRPSVQVAGSAVVAQVWRAYGTLGVHHILTGWDHLLFVIALVLLVRRGFAVAKGVTAFTVAHSLTLAAVTFGFVGLPQRPVEALIALSIVLVARELLRPAESPSLARRFPWVIAFVFGLVHGFGFAGALAAVGLPVGEMPAALLAFNLGVETGQLAVVFGVIALLAALRKLAPGYLKEVIRLAAYGIGATASYWLVARLVV